MRFTAIFLASALSAVAVATTSASPTYSLDPAQSSIIACLDKCGEADVDCKARCNPVPNPSETQVIQLDKCVGNCDQGKGTDADAQKYAECRASCISQYYYNSSDGTPRATGAAGGSNGNNGNTDAKATGTDSASGAGSTGGSDSSNASGSASGSQSGSASGTAGGAQSTDKPGSANQLVGSGAAVFALAAAVFAL